MLFSHPVLWIENFKVLAAENFFNILAYIRFLVHFGGQIQTSSDEDCYLQNYSSATKALRRMLAEIVANLRKIEAKKTNSEGLL